jgi:Cu(I)/Ag(I) efflux system membrane protein CusA/SilA
MLNKIIKFFIHNKLVAWLLLGGIVLWGLAVSPFNFDIDILPRDPVAVDAIPDIGENQQIIFTKWQGRSPQDVEDQITYPLTTALLGLPGVKTIRSNSMLGFSSIYVIFEEEIEFYWSRSRILEKLSSLPTNLLPENVQPTLGPDATALGQIYWYTLEGKDSLGNTTGGWDLHELRSIQDFYVKYGLSSASGVAEVASIGGFVKEYQVDVNPDKMRIYGITLNEVMQAIKNSNLDIGAQTIEINLAEYFVRGLGYVKSIEDIEQAVVKSKNNVPLLIKDIAVVNIGPATRRGILDKGGAEAVGGVVVARYGENPLEVIDNVKSKIDEISKGLPIKVLANGTISQVSIVPFYDRATLINETLGTLEEALSLEILITIIVVILMLFNLRSSLLVAGALPIAVLLCFIAMRYFEVDANIVALSGIAIAIGTIVDVGIVLSESMLIHIQEAPKTQKISTSVYNATTEVASAIVTAVATTVVSFLPVFTMEAAEGKLFRPLAFTKTFVLLASIVVALTIIPPLATQLFSIQSKSKTRSYLYSSLLVITGIVLLITSYSFLGIFALLIGFTSIISEALKSLKKETWNRRFEIVKNILYAMLITCLLSEIWMPLGVTKSIFINFLFVGTIIGSLISIFYAVIHFYESILRFLLKVKFIFLSFICLIIVTGVMIARNTGKEFMPSLDEGSFLLMPTAMPHAGMQMNISNLRTLDMAVTAIPEVEMVVGKAGRTESSLDPAPMSMYENMILYKTEYATSKDGHRLRFKTDNSGNFILKDERSISNAEAIAKNLTIIKLIQDEDGAYFRQWREHIHSADDIWNEIVAVTKLPGVTSAPKLQPIETRLIMLQTGMRAPMGIKVKGDNLESIEAFGIALETILTTVEGVKPSSVFADRIIGKPYLMIDIDRNAISRYGLSIVDVQNQIQVAIGGMKMTTTVEDRERYNIVLRYPRELRDNPEKIKDIFISTKDNGQIPLGDIVNIRYEQGPQAIKSEDGFLIAYVLFDKLDGFAEAEVVENAQSAINKAKNDGSLNNPASINYKFAGNYEQQIRANDRLAIVIPLALFLIFLILYFQFNSILTSLMVFTGVFVAFSGGFIMIWFYGQDWFMNFSLFEVNMRDLFQMKTLNLSVAVWVGFLALFGIATDDGVLIATFLKDSFKRNTPQSIEEIRDAVVEGGLRRVKPAMMTTATTILALLPILTSTGKGAGIMLPMAIPSFGGMTLQVITMFTVPILYALWKESDLKYKKWKS